ncbi:CD209 antigen-like protein D [Notolabrus celidotus]|uniref:CD209 antigen-like protein D n=1 Tax=Notolabrus celidotus TaxID=1203425 RepID=UPI00149087F5|nr:CD209 antigen-like protein D [Notolabrus celidotus]
MSTTFNDMPEEVRGQMSIDDGSRNRGRPQSLVWWIGAAVVCLVFHLLTVIFVANNTSAVNRWDTKSGHLMCNLTKDRDAFRDEGEALKQLQKALKDELDQLKTHYSDLTEERDKRDALNNELQDLKVEQDRLKTHYSDLTEERDKRDALNNELQALKVEQDRLKTQYSDLTQERDTLRDKGEALKDELDQLKTYFSNLTKERDTLRAENDILKNEQSALEVEQSQLSIQCSNLSKTMDALQSQYNSVIASRNQLQEEVNVLKVRPTARTCSQGWTMFNNKCYYFSPSGTAKTWEDSRQDCSSRGGQLTMPKTKVELTFVSRNNKRTWIGLSDKSQEGRWKWVDGTDKVSQGFWKQGEPNDANSNEDCAEVSQEEVKLNDVPCSVKFAWVCEA